MSSHPGSRISDAVELALFLKSENIRPEQVQDFYPTPGTVSTCMYYTGINPYNNEKVYVAKSKEEKAMQRALLQYYKSENRDIITKALMIANRKDLIGSTKECLVKASTKQSSSTTKGGVDKWQRSKKGDQRKGKKK